MVDKLYIIDEIVEKKNSQSKSVICRGYNKFGESIFYKISFVKNNISYPNSLAYELFLYKHIHNLSKKDSSIANYFVKFDEASNLYTYDKFVNSVDIKCLEQFNIKMDELYGQHNKNEEHNYLCVLITYDILYMTLSDYLYKYYTNIYFEKNNRHHISLINILTIVINGINILNKYKINHNDLHFKNILIDENENENETRYECVDANNKKYILISPISINIFDFDYGYTSELSSIFTSNNTNLHNSVKIGYGRNRYIPYRDYFIFIQQILIIRYNIKNNPNYTLLFRFINEFIQNVIPDPIVLRDLIENIKNILGKNTFLVDKVNSKKNIVDKNNITSLSDIVKISNKPISANASCIQRGPKILTKYPFYCNLDDVQLVRYFKWIENIRKNMDKYIEKLSMEDDYTNPSKKMLEINKDNIATIQYTNKYMYLQLKNKKN